MIAFLSGEVAAVLPPNTAYIDVAGVGYAVSMPQGDLGKLEVGKSARVLTYLSVSDNGLGLYGFLSDEEKALFEKLIGVSKVGPKMALAALSTYTPRELADAIAAQDIARVSHIPGVGKKTAERIILELKGTLERGLETLFDSGAADGVASAASVALTGATEALLSMGFTSAEAEVALKGAPEGAGEGALLQYALKRLGNR
ncbi:Holliday junction branch migration protein RuvA [Adlercreutzia muris]|uniref:Holliday junction branch migration complex subunit RuvA n=1 Tax=Adlercreutzia muris TaxID=1796610 RepID=A0A7C8FSY6_9ACTN|nr:Holliday junction branch migration protein RuvA [Adlercreutzia muris]KAB1648557.1 Holliday junction branch migration protein RuvA [Adlercreutzia muris]MCR2028938.1 Holliday junction branch migration protein RuvA [Adlercreutzia muris]MCU7585180.1 Holliday junction branch migration protein RuvA [Adlercreutzia muris]TGY67570.1 Holliday junction branch migration protein RuvA [Enterorhabdus sp. NM05_H27]